MGCVIKGTIKTKPVAPSADLKKSSQVFISNSIQTQPSNSLLTLHKSETLQKFYEAQSDDEVIQEISEMFHQSISCAVEFQELKEITQAFIKALNGFNIQITGDKCCAFELSKQLKIMLVYLKLKFPEIKATSMGKFPFVGILMESSDPIFEAWKEFIFFTKLVVKESKFYEQALHIEYVMKAFDEIADVEREFGVLDVECVKNRLKRCVRDARYMFTKARKIAQVFKVFSDDFEAQMTEICSLASQLQGNQVIDIIDIQGYI